MRRRKQSNVFTLLTFPWSIDLRIDVQMDRWIDRCRYGLEECLEQTYIKITCRFFQCRAHFFFLNLETCTFLFCQSRFPCPLSVSAAPLSRAPFSRDDPNQAHLLLHHTALPCTRSFGACCRTVRHEKLRQSDCRRSSSRAFLLLRDGCVASCATTKKNTSEWGGDYFGQSSRFDVPAVYRNPRLLFKLEDPEDMTAFGTSARCA